MNDLCWVSALPINKEGLHFAGEVHDLASAIELIAECLERQIGDRQNPGEYQPSVNEGHDPNGCITHGVVREYRIIDRDTARKHGIRQKAPIEIYVGLELTDAMRAAYERGEIRFTSPEPRGWLVDRPWSDSKGYEWPFYIAEFSLVKVPHNKDQVPADELRSMALADQGDTMADEQKTGPGAVPRKPPVRLADDGGVPTNDAPPAAADLAAEVRTMREEFGVLTEALKAVMEMMKAKAEVVDPAAMADKPPIKMSEDEEEAKNARIAELEAELASLRMEREADTEVAALEDEYVVAEPMAMRDVYVKGGKAAFDAAKRCLPKRGVATASSSVGAARPETKPRTAVGGGALPAMTLGDEQHVAAIRAYQAEHKVSYEAARVAVYNTHFVKK